MTNETGATPNTQPSAETAEPLAGTETDSGSEPNDELSGLKTALARERELRKLAERQAARNLKTDADRLRELESLVAGFQAREAVASALDSVTRDLEKSGEIVRREDVLELLEHVNLTPDNAAEIVGRLAHKLKRPAPIVTPNNATPAFRYTDTNDSEIRRNPLRWFGMKG